MKKYKLYWLLVGLYAVAPLTSVYAADNSAVVKFSADIATGTCTLTADPSVALGTVDASTLVGNNWHLANTKKFTLTLSHCTGIGGGELRPTITMTGTPLPISGWTNVFKDGGTSKGFGVMVFDADPGEHNSGGIANGGDIYLTDYGKGKTLPATGTTRDLWAVVACGPTASCADTNLLPGSLTASLTFAFAYK
ncbi:TPA: type 1 fimbrial protein [Serratia marcescens]|uniref:Type 1 fimbrial protein n=2 Tax=Serratia TaxID=613 RepID=A0A9X8VK00_SERMA|nr:MULTISPECIES: type 1 fimbrial protein [Serratia]MBS3894534.1 type 1 fimbrial protein [Serratia marcescens]TXE22546.1 type 1 fimbrial protein [Serratia ureilytica]HBC7422572.1 type 1 fimbrial protein [Serratia marcescens]